jgi:stalled ribosome rescue protein Dom34
MTTHHAAIWIDHNEARVLRLSEDNADFEVSVVHSEHHHSHVKKNDGHRHVADAHFLAKIVEAIASCDEVFLCGPAHTKDELVKHLGEHRPALAQRLLVEPADRLTDGQLADHARRVFRKADRMRGVHVG